MDIQKQILDPIDSALQPLEGIPDHMRSIEGSVWADLNESVEAGFRTMDEAQERFMQWRQQYLGRIGLNGS